MRSRCCAPPVKRLWGWSLLTICVALATITDKMIHQALGLSTTVAELSSKAFIRRCLQSPTRPESVLSFFFGADYFALEKGEAAPISVRTGSCLSDMNSLWFGGGDAYDQLCQPFADTVRLAGRRKLPRNSEWDSNINGLVAQLILTDQLSRNVFRGSDEAFEYQDVSLDLARRLAKQALGKATDIVEGELYPPYLCFTVTALMHSEQLSPDHVDLCLPLIDFAKSETSEDESLNKWWDFQKTFAQEHMNVIQRFGRYPHRNKFMKRDSTPDELEWLADVEKLPGWAKSMG